MKCKINFQTSDSLIVSIVESIEDFQLWSSQNLRTRTHKTFVAMAGERPLTKFPDEVYITSRPTDIELYFENVLFDNMIHIQEFEFEDYASIFNYLSDLYEVK